MPAPFGTLPLNTSLYGSRVEEFTSRNPAANYVLAGYRPGYALQASELNELQEQFYVQNTLSNLCLNSWFSHGYSTYPAPFWNGTTPYSPSNISIATPGNGTSSVTLNSGWYFLVDVKTSTNNRSNLGFWIIINTPINFTIQTGDVPTTVEAAPTRFGFVYEVNEVDQTSDSSLSDNANASQNSNIIPGATRISIKNISFQKFNSQPVFSEIFAIKRTRLNPIQYKFYWPYRSYSQDFTTVSG
jgi:hypothetical protein